MTDEVGVLARVSLVFVPDGKGYSELSTEVVATEPQEIQELFSPEDYVVVRASMNAFNRLSGKIQREIYKELEAIRSY